MTIDESLLAVLACPSEDHAPLRERINESGDPVLECVACLTQFPILDDIPVLLVDDATPGPNGIGVPADSA